MCNRVLWGNSYLLLLLSLFSCLRVAARTTLAPILILSVLFAGCASVAAAVSCIICTCCCGAGGVGCRCGVGCVVVVVVVGVVVGGERAEGSGDICRFGVFVTFWDVGGVFGSVKNCN